MTLNDKESLILFTRNVLQKKLCIGCLPKKLSLTKGTARKHSFRKKNKTIQINTAEKSTCK